MESKVKIYVCSFKMSPLDYVDTKSMGHLCVTSKGVDSLYIDYNNSPWKCGLLPENQRKVLDTVVEFCEQHNLEYEIFDMANLNLMNKIKFAIKGIKAPAIVFKGKMINEMSAKENLKTLIE